MAAEVTSPYIDSAYYFIKWSCYNYFLNIYVYTTDLLSNFSEKVLFQWTAVSGNLLTDQSAEN